MVAGLDRIGQINKRRSEEMGFFSLSFPQAFAYIKCPRKNSGGIYEVLS